jgi:hypothetical protein
MLDKVKTLQLNEECIRSAVAAAAANVCQESEFEQHQASRSSLLSPSR